MPHGSGFGPGRLFADDTIAYLVIATSPPPEDAKLLQEDLATLEEWERQWKVRFHPDKCTELTVTSKRKLVKTEYKLHDHIIASVSSAKHLGVTITEDFKWDTHIQNIRNKANRTIGFLKRNLSTEPKGEVGIPKTGLSPPVF